MHECVVCMRVNQAHHMFDESPRWTLLDYLSLHVVFNCMNIVFLDLIWL